jgi:hypothetical protein
MQPGPSERATALPAAAYSAIVGDVIAERATSLAAGLDPHALALLPR